MLIRTGMFRLGAAHEQYQPATYLSTMPSRLAFHVRTRGCLGEVDGVQSSCRGQCQT
jgi:hypothetical protein